MKKFWGISTVSLVLLSLFAAGGFAKRAQAQAPSQYPILDIVVNKVIAKYQQSSCEDLWKAKSEHAPPSPQEQQVLGYLHSNAEMRAVFISKVAAPIANKMFECGLLP